MQDGFRRPNTAMTDAFLSFRSIHKAFGRTIALSGVDLDVSPGQAHVLAGENGAGKSTLVKILMGVEKADSGEMLWRGRPHRPSGPAEALRSGIAMIYQELNLALHLPVYANVFLGRELRVGGFVRESVQKRRTRELLDMLGSDIDPTMPTRHLGIAQRQLVEIARALGADAELIVMDEPTASLSEQESESLFEVVQSLRERGVGIIYISHHLEEFGRIGDVITVLRDGRRVWQGPAAGTSPSDVIHRMVGRTIDEMYPSTQREPGEVLLSVRNLASPNGTRNASLEVRSGEVVGIAGLMGAGRTEMLRALFGLDVADVEELMVGGTRIACPLPHRLVRHRIGFLSEDRGGEGLAGNLSIGVNLSLSAPQRISRWGVLSHSRREKISTELIDQFRIKASSSMQTVGELSGGNQQKVALARLLCADAKVLLLDEPTRGIDVGAKNEIYQIMNRLAAEGRGVVFVSSYLPEILGMADSVYVMCRGTLSRKFRVDEVDQESVMALATGIVSENAHV
ncbi:MAG: sugar ABC transporter ATP-binding protein [bacterium]